MQIYIACKRASEGLFTDDPALSGRDVRRDDFDVAKLHYFSSDRLQTTVYIFTNERAVQTLKEAIIHNNLHEL